LFAIIFNLNVKLLLLKISAFGHLDNINASVKSGNQSFFLADAHIRFERVTELRMKSGEQIEEASYNIYYYHFIYLKIILFINIIIIFIYFIVNY
jgi:hypothetical protein